MFHLQHTFTIPNGASAFLQLNTYEHIFHTVARIEKFNGGSPIKVELFENPTVVNGNIPPDLIANLDRRSSKTPSVDLFVNPTGIVGGTLADLDFITSTSGLGGNSAGSLSAPDFERILKQNSKYILKYTNQGTQSTTLHLTLIFYETTE